jgi:hypothetical protein
LEVLTEISPEERKYLAHLISGNEEKDVSKVLQLMKKMFN